MKIYQLWQDRVSGYDTYDGAIVVAANEYAARKIHPSGNQEAWGNKYNNNWLGIENVSEIEVTYIGETHLTEEQVLLASFNAG